MPRSSRTRPSNDVSSTTAVESCEMRALSVTAANRHPGCRERGATPLAPSKQQDNNHIAKCSPRWKIDLSAVPRSKSETGGCEAGGALAALHHQLLDLGDRLRRIETLR